MTDVHRRRLEQQRDVLLARLPALPNLMRGSVYERVRQCGRASCACAQGGPKHPSRPLTVTLRGATHTRYVRHEEVAPLQQLLATYKELWRIVDELTAVNLALLHSAPPRVPRPRARPAPR